MSSDLSRRCTWLLWFAMAAATAAGLLAAPAFDPLGALHRFGLLGLALAVGLHALLGAGTALWLARLADVRWLPAGLALAALGLLLMALRLPTQTDARLLLWLDGLPLCWLLAELSARPVPGRGPTATEADPSGTPSPQRFYA